MFAKMPERKSSGNPKLLRRSPRFLPQVATPEPQESKRKPNHKPKSTQAHGDSGSKGFTPRVSAPTTRSKASQERVLMDRDRLSDGTRGVSSLSSCGLRRSRRFVNGDLEIRGLRRSPRFLNQDLFEKCLEQASRNDQCESVKLGNGSRGSSKLSDGSRKCADSSVGFRKSSRLVAAGLQVLRRSLRFSNAENVEEAVDSVDEEAVDSVDEEAVEDVDEEAGEETRINEVRGFMACSTSKSADPKRSSKDSDNSSVGSRKCANSVVGLMKASRANAADGNRSLRRSPRFLTGKKVDESAGEPRSENIDTTKKGDSSQSLDKKGSGDGKAKVYSGIKGGCTVADVEAIERTGTKRKRNEAKKAGNYGWTEEQKFALNNAYLAAKPTPHFWKKVSKLVPGKSEQECFDKIHADHLTPLQPRRRSRVKSIDASSPSISASRLLQPTEPKRRVTYNKHKSLLGQKSIRKLLHKHSHINQDCEVDLFSVLEASMTPSIPGTRKNTRLSSTPKRLLEKVVAEKTPCLEPRKQLSRFSSSAGTPSSSPPVLKQVKDQALHEKYISQLHNRDAKRKAASSRAAKSAPDKENRQGNCIQRFDVVGAAKTALVSDVQDVINQFQRKKFNAAPSFSELDDDIDIDRESECDDET